MPDALQCRRGGGGPPLDPRDRRRHRLLRSAPGEAKYFEAAREMGDKLRARWECLRRWRAGEWARGPRCSAGGSSASSQGMNDLGVGEASGQSSWYEGLRERKGIMDTRGDAVVALHEVSAPREILEVMAIKQLGYHRKPIAVLDLDGFYQPLWSQIQRGIDTGFIKPEYLDLWYPAPDVDALLRYVEGYEPHAYGAKWT